MCSRGSTQQLFVETRQHALIHGLYTLLCKGLWLSGHLPTKPNEFLTHFVVGLNPPKSPNYSHVIPILYSVLYVPVFLYLLLKQ